MANITGTNNNDVLTGGAFNDIINGLAGADKMAGGKSDDLYYVDNLGDTVTEKAGDGTDTVVSSIALANAFANVENYDFSKVAAPVNFTGNALDNVIKGTAGTDTLAGGFGNDIYHVSSASDVIIENAGAGTDTIVAGFSVDLANYANVENVTLLGSAALKATGSSSNNELIGNAGANVLDGKGGADLMQGGKGNDTYYADTISDNIVEHAGEGFDTVVTSANYNMDAHVEKLVQAAGAGDIWAYGNLQNNLIVGNEGNNSLDGYVGADTMKGGKGNDTYFVDHAGDKVVELAGEGHDAIVSTIDFSLAALVNVEDLYLDGFAVKGTGNALNNLIVGTGGHNILYGGAGADTMVGGDGGDKYYVDNLNDLVVENANEGWDTVYSTVALTHGFANVEDYDFSKAKSAVNFTGTDDNNRIFASVFNDTLAGGKGDDTYYLNNVGDKVVELSGEGKDTIISSVSVAKLADNVESVILKEGAGALSAVGNELDNYIGGNSGNNVLKGGIGNDTIAGGSGNDVLTGGVGADEFQFWGAGKGGSLSGHDLITDFDFNNDILAFHMAGDADGDGSYGEYEDFVASIIDQGAGKDVVLSLISGASITFKGIGTGMIDHITDLVANPATQIISD